MKNVVRSMASLSLAIASASAGAAEPQSYLILAERMPVNLERQVARAGGTITHRIPEAGVVVASSANPGFARAISGVQAVMPDIRVQMTKPVAREAFPDDILGAAVVSPPGNDGSYDTRYALQWGLDAVDAPEAWASGSTGAGVRVAVLDGGFQLNHPDLAANINLALSADFTGQGIEYGPNPEDLSGIFSHGMHVAGTIAAPRNGIGVIGVAYEAELVLVKVLLNEGYGSFADVIAGVIYAASVDADVINMSLGADIPQGLGIDANQVAALRAAFNRAFGYANRRGATVIVAAGNDGRNLDKDQSLTVFPAQMSNAISISATAPIGWAVDPANASLDYLASYSNYGNSGINLAAPGGDFVYPGNEGCLIGGLVRPCWVFDLVFSTGAANALYWSAGTSMAAPHAAGIAALIIGENGGSMHPAQVKAELQRRASDLGKPGKDPLYGNGRVSSGY